MTLPGILLGILLSTIAGLLFHLVRGGSLGRLALFIATAWLSFFLGHLLGEWLDWHWARLGTLNLLSAGLATFIGLMTANLLAGPAADEPPPGGRRRRRRPADDSLEG